MYVCKQPDGRRQARYGRRADARRGDPHRATTAKCRCRRAGMLKEYYKRPDATAESIDADGWFMTGDAGYFDGDGHLKIIDRAKDVGRLADGTLFAPQVHREQAQVLPATSRRPWRSATRARWSARLHQHRPRGGGQLGGAARPRLFRLHRPGAASPRSTTLVRECVEQVNARSRGRARCSANSQIRRFLVLHKELDADDGELTRTRKVRRGFIAEKYARAGGCAVCRRQTLRTSRRRCKFEDGRTGMIRADVKIRDAETFPAVAGKAAA